jgi:hypothetical protein
MPYWPRKSKGILATAATVATPVPGILENGTPATQYGLDWPMHPTMYHVDDAGDFSMEDPPHYLLLPRRQGYLVMVSRP